MTLAISPQPSVCPDLSPASAAGSPIEPPYLPPPGPAPTKAGPYRFTREQYYQMAELGFFQDRHVELIDGVIFDMSPQGNPHVHAVSNCSFVLRQAFGPKFRIRIEANLHLGTSEPEPDIAVVLMADDKSLSTPDSALLVVEASLTTLAYDRGDKASLYAAAGIADYWIINLHNNSVEVRREPRPDAAARFGHSYGHLTTLAPPATVSPLALPGAKIAVADFFL